MTFNKVLALLGLGLVAIIVIAFFWPGILYYAALALAILWFPIIIAMCGGWGIQSSNDEHA